MGSPNENQDINDKIVEFVNNSHINRLGVLIKILEFLTQFDKITEFIEEKAKSNGISAYIRVMSLGFAFV